MKLSFNDEESFMQVIEGLCFNNPPSDPYASQEMGISMPLQDFERNEDNITPSDAITFQVRRVGSSSSIQEIRRSEDI